jgi:hypothetical protein
MFKIQKDAYEAMIPKQKESCTLSFYVQSIDKAGNIAKTDTRKITVGEEESLINNSAIIILIIVIVIFAVRRFVVTKKVRDYASKHEFKKK